MNLEFNKHIETPKLQPLDQVLQINKIKPTKIVESIKYQKSAQIIQLEKMHRIINNQNELVKSVKPKSIQLAKLNNLIIRTPGKYDCCSYYCCCNCNCCYYSCKNLFEYTFITNKPKDICINLFDNIYNCNWNYFCNCKFNLNSNLNCLEGLNNLYLAISFNQFICLNSDCNSCSNCNDGCCGDCNDGCCNC